MDFRQFQVQHFGVLVFHRQHLLSTLLGSDFHVFVLGLDDVVQSLNLFVLLRFDSLNLLPYEVVHVSLLLVKLSVLRNLLF